MGIFLGNINDFKPGILGFIYLGCYCASGRLENQLSGLHQQITSDLFSCLSILFKYIFLWWTQNFSNNFCACYNSCLATLKSDSHKINFCSRLYAPPAELYEQTKSKHIISQLSLQNYLSQGATYKLSLQWFR